MSKNANQILEKAVTRCKKAQSIARPFNNKKKVKAGCTVQQKMIELLEMTQENEYGELAAELQTLDNMITNMQKGVLEQLLESVETIERRMKTYQKTLKHGNDDNDTTATPTPTATVTADDDDDVEILSEEAVEDVISNQHPTEETPSIEEVDGYNDDVEEEGSEITAMQQRFMDRLRNFFSVQRIAEDRVGIVDPQGKVR